MRPADTMPIGFDFDLGEVLDFLERREAKAYHWVLYVKYLSPQNEEVTLERNLGGPSISIIGSSPGLRLP